MRLEFIGTGGLDCPLILFTGGDAEAVQSLIDGLRSVEKGPTELQSLRGINAMGGIRVEASLGKRNKGLHRVRDGTFEWTMDLEGWRQVIDLLAPFCDRASSGSRFQFLSREGPVAVLISTDGRW